jgi:Lhr-like helicase
MNNIINLAESESTFPTSSFPYAKFPFDNFNKVQASLLSVVEKDCNILIATATSSGKTVMAEMFGSYELRKNNKKLLFLCPLRALANEKFYDWTNSSYHFSDLKIGIFTGDFKKDNKGDLSDLDIIIMTSEMLNHKLRSASSKTDWIKNIGVICIDESHLLTVPGRGDHLESAIMNFSKINCNSRFVLLSATLPNVDEVASWIGKSINWIAKKLAGKDEVKIATWIEKNAHKWEKLYIKAIVGAIKLTGFASRIWKKEDGSVDEQKLLTTAQVIYVVILAVAAGAAAKTVLGPSSPVIKALEGTFGSIKVGEIVSFISKIKSQIT